MSIQNFQNKCSSFENTESSPPLTKPKAAEKSLFCVYLVLKRLTASATHAGSRRKNIETIAKMQKKDEQFESKNTAQNLKNSKETETELLNKYRQITENISQTHVYTGQGTFGRPFEHLLNSLDTASGVSGRLHGTSGNNVLTYLLARGVGRYHQSSGPPASPSSFSPYPLFPYPHGKTIRETWTAKNTDKSIAFVNVFETKSKLVALYVAWCIKQYSTKQATEDPTTVQAKTAIMQPFSKTPYLVSLLFDPDVTYLIACHMIKRVVLASERLQWFSLSEYIFSRQLVCLHSQYPLPNLIPKHPVHFQQNTVEHTVPHDASHTFIPLNEAGKFTFALQSFSVKQQLHQYLINEVFVSMHSDKSNTKSSNN